MSTVTTRADATVVRPWQQLTVIWALLLTAPFWLPYLGGYTAIAPSIFVPKCMLAVRVAALNNSGAVLMLATSKAGFSCANIAGRVSI